MLSYQHIYHAGNLADVHKHAALAVMLAHLLRKDKPLTYLETHAGRGLYDLASHEAQKTGEAKAGIRTLFDRLAQDHPLRATIAACRAKYGDTVYPGSPAIAQSLLRRDDRLHLAELHPRERQALTRALADHNTRIHAQDGYEMAQALCPPMPRRGLMLVDPSYELASDYTRLPGFLAQIHRKWNVGVLVLWYPILTRGAHDAMLTQLRNDHPEAWHHQVHFPPARDGHRMVGSGLFVINPPFALEQETPALHALFAGLA